MMYTKDFNSLPHAEVDSLFSSISLLLPYFNSLPHAEVDVLLLSIFAPSVIFQLTTSRRGRPIPFSQLSCLFLFQLTTSRRGRRYQERFCPPGIYFNSLPHAEVDKELAIQPVLYKYFNSLPHAEVDDGSEAITGRPVYISTHYLTQR